MYLLLALTILYTIESFAFELQVPSNTTIFKPTTLNTASQSGDPQNIGIIWVEDNENSGGCPANPIEFWQNTIKKIDLKKLPDGSDTHQGSESFTLYITGQIRLCAYSYECQPQNVTSLANSAITVDPPSINPPTQKTATTITTTSPGPTATNARENTSPPKNRGLTGAGIGVVVLGIIVILGLLIGLLYLIYRRRRHRKCLNDFHKDRMVLAAQVPRIASPESVIPKKHVSQTITLSDSDHSQSVPFYTFPGEKDGQRSYGEGSLAPLRSMNV
ncbi:hypothetical protein MPER_11552 [Moniliophthora perniciosa FA553]|nr:hypothetical protein MPER_11552 [Moniliophthora perniciosa FA553]